ncbi:MAG: Uma2 family endonuclease [Betaproteobacteria bacterium]|nr:MAG: Uma2 family endonuclease [Betaproteobacteria bacterium]
MSATPEVIDKPLSYEALAEMYRAMCDDPRFANIPGKLELDTWGRIIMSPASNYHGNLQARLVERLQALGGQRFVEASVLTPIGLLVPDVAWASTEFLASHGNETPFTTAPELCIEVASPSNSLKELNEKVAAYLAAGATEAWIVYPQSKRFEFHGPQGRLAETAFTVDLNGLFD